jgi:hypothetical protein
MAAVSNGNKKNIDLLSLHYEKVISREIPFKNTKFMVVPVFQESILVFSIN